MDTIQMRYSTDVRRLPGLKRAREAVPMTQEELATASGVSRITIARLETGRSEARPATTRRLAAALKVKPAALMADGEGRDGSA